MTKTNDMVFARCTLRRSAVENSAAESSLKEWVLQIHGDHVRKLRDYCQLYGTGAVHSWDPRVSFDFEPNCD